MPLAPHQATLDDVSDDVELRVAWHAIAARAHRAEEVFDDLVGRHRQPHRRYHGVRHVVWVLRNARALEVANPACAAGAGDYDAGVVSAAAFFHDAVYDPTRGDNEERSALLAERQLDAIGWDQARRDRVGTLVRATATHLSDEPAARSDLQQPADVEQQVMLDADLAVLGAGPNAYAAYARGVRVEYGHLDADEWAKGRAGVLRHLLDRSVLYGTEPARQWWEARARANLTAELTSL